MWWRIYVVQAPKIANVLFHVSSFLWTFSSKQLKWMHCTVLEISWGIGCMPSNLNHIHSNAKIVSKLNEICLFVDECAYVFCGYHQNCNPFTHVHSFCVFFLSFIEETVRVEQNFWKFCENIHNKFGGFCLFFLFSQFSRNIILQIHILKNSRKISRQFPI